MPMRPPAGFISAFYDPLRNPNAPVPGTPVAGDSSAEIPVSGPLNQGGSAVTLYSAISTPGSFIGSAASSPVTVTGLTNGSSYTFIVWATNSYGPSAYSGASSSVTPTLQRGLFASGYTSSGFSNVIDYISISTTGNAIDFGDFTNRYLTAGCASSTRGLFGGGEVSGTYTASTSYVTIATTGNAISFGSLTQDRRALGSCSSSTRGVFAGGTLSGPPYASNVMDYFTIASTGNAIDFGDLTEGSSASTGGCGSSTRGLIGAVTLSGISGNGIDYITIASTGNAINFGALTGGSSRNYVAAASNSTRAIFGAGGAGASSIIDYVTIATTGNATNFGSLLSNILYSAGVASSIRAVFGGGDPVTNVIQYVTIATTGNSTDFGDLTVARYGSASCSNCHGGI